MCTDVLRAQGANQDCILSGVLRQIENLPECHKCNLEFDFGVGKFLTLSSDYSEKQELGTKRSRIENRDETGTERKRLCLSLKKKRERFVIATNEEIVAGTRGVLPTNTKSNKEWAVRNLQA